MTSGRVILVALALLGICMSMTTATAMHFPAAPEAADAVGDCCQGHHEQETPTDSSDEKHSDCGGKCLAACCRVISTVEPPHAPSDRSPAISFAATWSIVAFNLTDPESIFHPPRS